MEFRKIYIFFFLLFNAAFVDAQEVGLNFNHNPEIIDFHYVEKTVVEWFPDHNLLTYYERFEKYGVVLATYPLFQQSAPKNMTVSSPAWFIDPVFCQKSLLKQANGEYSTNPLHYKDFIRIVKEGKAGK